MTQSMESANNSNSREDDIIHIEETYSISDDDAVAVVVRTTAVVAASIVATTNFLASTIGNGNIYASDHRTEPRKKRRVFDHSGALPCIQRDYLGGHPLFGKEFPMMFRLSWPRFEVMMQDIQQKQIMFYMNDMDRHGNPSSSFQARLLLPLKTLAYGVPPHAFMDYFQMSEQFARD
jgi:hypothetical protein